MQTHPGWFLPVLLCYMFSISPYKLTVKNKNKQPTKSPQRGQNLLPVVSWILFCFFGFPQNVFLDELKGCWWKSTTSSGECRELYLEEWAPRTGRYWPGPPHPFSASLVFQMVKNLPAVQETWVWSLGWEDPLEKRMAIHSSNLAWRKSWTEEPGRLQGYSPWGCKELDMTEQLVCARAHTHTNTFQLSLSLAIC